MFSLLVFSMLFMPGTPAAAESSGKNILIINSYNNGFTWTDDEIEGILSTLNASNYSRNIFIEYLDWKNSPYLENLRKEYELIKYKYSGKKIDIIIATDDAAVNFSLKLRSNLFGNIPVVFSGVYPTAAEKFVKRFNNVTGTVEMINAEETLKTAFSIYPDARKVYVIHDNTESGIASEDDVREAVKKLKRNVKVEFFGSLRLNNLDNNIPPDYDSSILYMTSFSRDEDGNTLQIEKMSEILSAKLKVPIFDAYDMTIGSGVVGGNMLSGVLQGKKAGELALRILNGESASGIPLVKNNLSVNKYDYNVLKRFNIPVSKLPHDSIIVNRPFSFYQSYKSLVWNVVIIFSILVLFCIILLANAIERKVAQAKLELSNRQLTEQYRELERSREIIKKNEERYKLVFEASNDGLWELDPASGQRYYTEKWYDILGFRKDNSQKNVGDWYSIICIEDLAKVKRLVDDIMSGKTDAFSSEYRIVKPNGEYRWIFTRARSAKDENGNVTRIVGSHSDIHSRKLQEEQIRNLAYFDTLTGLANRVHMIEHFRKLSEGACEKAALAFIDLDNFKTVNDSLGHTNGDKFLVEVGSRLCKLSSSRFMVARLGGDEFAILMKSASDIEKISEDLDKITNTISSKVSLNGMEISLSASIGIALYPKDGENFDELLKNADIAMYWAKTHGKHKYVFFEEFMQKDFKEKLLMENSMHTALENGEFALHYQPLFDLKNRKTYGFEALLRWNSPVYGKVSPLRFISLAEETGFIIPLGKWVIEQACTFIKETHAAGYPEIVISVNVSIAQVLQSDFTEMVIGIVKSAGIDPKYLNIEITESIFMESVESNIEKIERLRERGISVSLDDFGKGYSSLTYLRRLPIDILKIDKEFVQESMEEHKSQSITGAIISLAHKLGLKVVAEGVETGEQLQYLSEQKCDYIQGFLFNPPVDKKEVYSILESMH